MSPNPPFWAAGLAYAGIALVTPEQTTTELLLAIGVLTMLAEAHPTTRRILRGRRRDYL